MRFSNIATLLLLAGSFTIACNSDDGEGEGVDGGTTTSGGTTTGGTTTGGTTTGDTTSGGTTTGDTTSGGSGSSADCEASETSTAGGNPLIDDFDHGQSWNLSDDSDGRVGTWEHEYWDFTGATTDRLFSEPECGEPEGCTSDGMGGASGTTPGYLKISCSGEGDQGWCATAWDSGNPWAQWAAVSTRLTSYTADEEDNCYNAAQYTGIKFKARSASGEDKLLLQGIDPSADPTQGWVYKSETISLTTDWVEYEVPFEGLTMADWIGDAGGPSGSVDASSLEAIAFAVRTVTDEMAGAGESLKPYEIHIDDVSFY